MRNRGPEKAKDTNGKPVEVQVIELQNGIELSVWSNMDDDAEEAYSLLFTHEAWTNLTGGGS